MRLFLIPSEDKEKLVKRLASALTRMDYRVWYDEFELRVGDSLRQSIDKGLVNSRFGIVVLSPAFFAKNWLQYELNGLPARKRHRVLASSGFYLIVENRPRSGCHNTVGR